MLFVGNILFDSFDDLKIRLEDVFELVNLRLVHFVAEDLFFRVIHERVEETDDRLEQLVLDVEQPIYNKSVIPGKCRVFGLEGLFDVRIRAVLDVDKWNSSTTRDGKPSPLVYFVCYVEMWLARILVIVFKSLRHYEFLHRVLVVEDFPYFFPSLLDGSGRVLRVQNRV